MAKRGQTIEELDDLGDLDDLFEQQGDSKDTFWDTLFSQVKQGMAIPFISSQMVYDLVFSRLLDQPEPVNADDSNCDSDIPVLRTTVTSLICGEWAKNKNVNYPFPETYDFARVAQYVQSVNRTSAPAKEQYIRFMKEYLLRYAARQGADRDHIRELIPALGEYSFSDLVVKELELLKFGPDCTDPLSILASLDLPVYITTSYHDLLESALRAMGKNPITQICPWLEAMPTLDKAHQEVANYYPSPQTPIVFHLFGLDQYPLTMVLAEDDYLDFLIKLTSERGTSSSIIPSYLQSTLKVSLLMLLGYSLQSWDFRTVFRSIISTRKQDKIAPFSNTIIQLSLTDQYILPDNDQKRRQYMEDAQKHLQEYFNPMAFQIKWNSTDSFLGDLLKEKRKRQK